MAEAAVAVNRFFCHQCNEHIRVDISVMFISIIFHKHAYSIWFTISKVYLNSRIIFHFCRTWNARFVKQDSLKNLNRMSKHIIYNCVAYFALYKGCRKNVLHFTSMNPTLMIIVASSFSIMHFAIGNWTLCIIIRYQPSRYYSCVYCIYMHNLAMIHPFQSYRIVLSYMW